MHQLAKSRIPILVLGPILLVWFSYWISIERPRQIEAASVNSARRRAVFVPIDGKTEQQPHCNLAARALAARLDQRFRIVVRSPYVLAGNMTPEELDEHYSRTIVPTARALTTSYFDQEPTAPIVILLFANEASYRDIAWKFDKRDDTAYYGYYVRPERRIMLNIATGNGTLAHELTHALAHFDFPTMPEWFDEGLASLHEESEFSDDGLRLIGRSNWRLHQLRHTLRRNRLRPLGTMIAATGIRPGHETVDYAHARYFCLFLQERQLLTHFYRKLRMRAADGVASDVVLRELFDVVSVAEIDKEFRDWLAELQDSKRHFVPSAE